MPKKKKQQMPTTAFQGSQLDVHCTFCAGTGDFDTAPKTRCPFCGGVGLKLTPEGEALISVPASAPDRQDRVWAPITTGELKKAMICIKEIIRKCRWCEDIIHDSFNGEANPFASTAAAWSYVCCFVDVDRKMHVCAPRRTGITDVVGFTTEDTKEEK